MRSIFLTFFLLGSLSANAAVQSIDRIIAIINDDVIISSELELRLKTIKGQLSQRGTKVPPEAVLRKQVLERLILQRLQLQAASRAGVRVDERTLNASVKRIANQNNLSLGQFRSALEDDGFDFSVFREDIRREMIISRFMQRTVRQRVNITEQEIDNFLSTNKTQNADNNEFRISHILIALPESADAEKINIAQNKAQSLVVKLRNGEDFSALAASNSDGKQAFEGGDLGWRRIAQIPSIFSEAVKEMKKNDVSQPIRSASGFHIIKVADIRGDSQRHLVNQTLSRHILIRTNELTSDIDAQTRLSQLQLRMQNGEEFSSLARAHSDDRGSAAKGGELGWTSPGALVPQFEAAMGELEKGQISEPFKSSFGWHIVQVLDRREFDDTDTFLRGKAREFLGKRKADEAGETMLRRLRDEAFVEYRLDDI